MKLVESERSKGAKTSHPDEQVGIPKGAVETVTGSDGNQYYRDANKKVLGMVK